MTLTDEERDIRDYVDRQRLRTMALLFSVWSGTDIEQAKLQSLYRQNLLRQMEGLPPLEWPP